MMKGQYRIVSELILFGVGIMITTYVIVNFGSVQETVKDVTLRDQLESIADVVSTAIVKTSNCESCVIRLSIPDKVSDSLYKIYIKSEYEDITGGVLIINTVDGKVSVQRQLFNINYDNIVGSGDIINNSEVTSNAQFIEIFKNEKITIRRVSLSSPEI
jgi:hypothetical protein